MVNEEFCAKVSHDLKRFDAKHIRLNSNHWAVADRERDYWTNIPLKRNSEVMKSPIDSPLQMSEMIEDYRGIWTRVSTLKSNVDGTYGSDCGWKEGRPTMFTLTTMEKHYPIAGHQMNLLEEDFDITRKHPETKQKHTLHLTKKGVAFKKKTKGGVLTDIVLTANVERHQLLEREGATSNVSTTLR